MASLPEHIDRQIRRDIQAGLDRVYCSMLETVWEVEAAMAAIPRRVCEWCGEGDPVLVTGPLCDACETRRQG